MNAIQNVAVPYVGSKLLKGFRLRWLLYGAAVYYGLRYMNKRGIMPKQTDAALGLIDRGIDLAKTQFGIKNSSPSVEQPITH